MINADIESLLPGEGIHKCYYSQVQNYRITNLKLNINQQWMIQRLLVNGIDTLGKLNAEKQNLRHNNLYLDIHQIYHTIPGSWRRLLLNTSRTHPEYRLHYNGTNKWSEKGPTLKDIKIILNQGMELNINNHVTEKHPTIVQGFKNPFVSLLKTTKDVKLKNIQYKILHNIYPTMQHLHKWKLKPTPNCSMCNSNETIKHAIFECPIANDAINKLERFVLDKTGVNIVLDYNDVLLGTESSQTNHQNLNHNQKSFIDTCLILLKQTLILQRETKNYLSEEKLISILSEHAKREIYNKVAYKKQRFNNYWYDLVRSH